MHRFRCLLSLGLAFTATLVCNYSTSAHESPSGDRTAASPSPAASGTADRLATRLRLGDGLNTWQPTRKQIGVSYAPGVTDMTPGSQVHFLVDRVKLRHYLSKTARYIRRSPQDARVVVAVHNATDEGNAQVPAKIVPGHDGAYARYDAAVDLIQKTMQIDPGTIHIVLPVKTKPAQVRAADLQGVNARIGYFVTHFNPGEVGRTETVRRAISIIDGTSVKPGGIFSINQTVGERDPRAGLRQGPRVRGRHTWRCRSAAACARSRRPCSMPPCSPISRSSSDTPHVRTIPYVDPGRDATVYWGQKDFKITNNTDAPLYISYKTTTLPCHSRLVRQSRPGPQGQTRQPLPPTGGTSFHRRLLPRRLPNPTARSPRPAFYSDYKWTPALDYSH